MGKNEKNQHRHGAAKLLLIQLMVVRISLCVVAYTSQSVKCLKESESCAFDFCVSAAAYGSIAPIGGGR